MSELLATLLFAASVLIIISLVKSASRRPRRNVANFRRPIDQLSAIEQVRFQPRTPINKSAYRIFRQIEDLLQTRQAGERPLAEVSLGAFLGTDDAVGTEAARDQAFRSINSKRVDFLVIDRFGAPALAVEYQGGGHHIGGTAAARDAVKKRALQIAGIELIEIFDYSTREEYIPLLSATLARHEMKRQSARRSRPDPTAATVTPLPSRKAS